MVYLAIMAKKPIFVKLIMFDLDGTLIDSKDDIIDAINATLKHLGLRKKPKNRIASFIGWGSNSLLEGTLGTQNRELMKKAIDFYWWHYRRHGLDKTRLYPGTKDVLEHFKGKTMAIVSNKARAFVVQQLKELGIRKFFKVVIGGDDIKCSKPSPCPVNILLKRFNVRRKDAIIIGDMSVDIETGKAAKIHTCAISSGGIGSKKDLLASGPEIVIRKITDLKRIIL